MSIAKNPNRMADEVKEEKFIAGAGKTPTRELRSKQLIIRLSPSLLEAIQAGAHRCGLTASGFASLAISEKLERMER